MFASSFICYLSVTYFCIDPNYSAGPILGNPIVLIAALIGVLVILGGQGVFY